MLRETHSSRSPGQRKGRLGRLAEKFSALLPPGRHGTIPPDERAPKLAELRQLIPGNAPHFLGPIVPLKGGLS